MTVLFAAFAPPPPFTPSSPPVQYAQRGTAVAWAAAAPGNIYTFVCSHDADMTLFTLNPFTGLLSPHKVGVLLATNG